MNRGYGSCLSAAWERMTRTRCRRWGWRRGWDQRRGRLDGFQGWWLEREGLAGPEAVSIGQQLKVRKNVTVRVVWDCK